MLTFSYDATGNLTQVQDNQNQILSQMTYDLLGRKTQETRGEGTSTWEYDTATNGIGKLNESEGYEGERRTFTYDSLGRPSTSGLTWNSQTYSATYNYDSSSRLNKVTYPTGYEVKY